MNPDVAAAVDDLGGRGILTDTQARLFRRVARAQLVSVHGELHALLYLGVLLTVAGVGWLLKDQMTRIGPMTIVFALALAAAGCFLWVHGRAPAFSWAAAPAAHLGLEYILLLGVLLAAADLAYVEMQFSALGQQWPWHLLIVSLAAAALAFRYDSKLVLSLAVSSFAAWRGASVPPDGFLYEFELAMCRASLRGGARPCRSSSDRCGRQWARRRPCARMRSAAACSSWPSARSSSMPDASRTSSRC